MAFRVLFIENELDIKIKLDNMVISRADGDIWIPIDDISMIVLDNLRTNLTTRTMCLLAEHNVGLVICDREHNPIGYYSSYDNHSRISKCIGYQIEKDKSFYDELWKNIVKEKIENQAAVLGIYDKNYDVILNMFRFAEETVTGDITNREAHAAKIYFNELMGCTFSRGNEDLLINSGLDYGYAVIRAYIARLCVGYGLNTQLGIHHKNEYNRFNLVDDLIEPIRPFVDLYVYKILKNEEYFKPEHRMQLVNLLNHRLIYKGKKMYLCNMLEEYISQYAAFISGKRENVIYPKIKDYIGDEDEV